jgi:NADH:ubiquinone oxidoreductase subunit 3 (subunit A)
MEQDLLADTLVALTPVIALVTILTWLGALILHYAIKKALTKISAAQSPQDLSRFRCETVIKRGKRSKIFHKFFLIMIIILVLNYVLGVVLRYLLLRERTPIDSGFYQAALYVVRPVSILALSQALGAVTITKTVNGYYAILMGKCKELGLTGDAAR